jgi:hypothetical protein
MRSRKPDKFWLAYPHIKPNPQRYQFSEEPEIYLRCTTLKRSNLFYCFESLTDYNLHKKIIILG